MLYSLIECNMLDGRETLISQYTDLKQQLHDAHCLTELIGNENLLFIVRETPETPSEELEMLKDNISHVLGDNVLIDEILRYLGHDESYEMLLDIANNWEVI